MASCPKCKARIPFYGMFFFQNDFYRCLKCKAPYVWTWSSSFLNLVIAYLSVVIVTVIAVPLFEIAKMEFYSAIFASLAVGAVFFGSYSYVWWRFFARLKEPGAEDRIAKRILAIIAVLAVLYAALLISERYFLRIQGH
jgi:hypothetical protein